MIQIITVPSMTTSGKSYQMCIKDGVVESCGCPVWSKGHKRCKHMRQEQIKIENENERVRARYALGYYDCVA